MAMRSRDEPKNFVNYLPQDEAVAMGFGRGEHCVDFMESQRSVDLLNRELSLLLKLNHAGFWRVVKEDISLLEFLDSFLQFRSRWYDFPHHGYTGTSIIIGESELARRVFMVLYRMSLNNIEAEHMIITNWKCTKGNIILNLSNLLDICGIYFHENPLLTTSLVNNVIKSGPDIHCDFVPLMYNFFNMFYTMNQRCRTTLQICEGNDFGHSNLDLLEVMDFLNDAVVSMDCLVQCYEPAAALFCCPVEMSYGTEELIIRLAASHDLLIPTLERGLRIEIHDGNEINLDRQLSDICVRLKLLSLRILKFGWTLLESCFLDGNAICGCLSHSIVTKIFPACLEDPIVRADILVQTFRSISDVSSEIGKGRTFLQSMENSYGIMSRIEHLVYKGWISTDSKQMEYLKEIISTTSLANTDSETSKILKEGDRDVIWESKLSQIRDIFPDVGNEFLSTCLKVCDNNPELVIQRILDGALHETSPEILHFSTQDKNNKRKEKVIECNWDNKEEKVMRSKGQLPPFNGNFNSPKVPSIGGGSCSSSLSSGRYVRKQKNMEIAEINKFDNREMKDSKRLAAIISQYEYEDEYDDSFDELGLTVDSGFNDDEIIVEEKCSTLSSENVIVQPASNQKWKSQKKPQFYVKDGRNYSYNVAGSTAAWNANEAFFVSRVQKEQIHGLGHGGNIPIGAMEKLASLNEEDGDRVGIMNELQVKKGETHSGKHGGGRNHSRKDRALRKHISSLGGF